MPSRAELRRVIPLLERRTVRELATELSLEEGVMGFFIQCATKTDRKPDPDDIVDMVAQRLIIEGAHHTVG